jgi:hypothetical protein
MLDGAKSDYFVSLGDGLGSSVLYIDVRQCKGAHDFAEEGGFLVVRLDQGEGDLRGPEFDREAGEASAGTEVGYGEAVGRWLVIVGGNLWGWGAGFIGFYSAVLGGVRLWHLASLGGGRGVRPYMEQGSGGEETFTEVAGYDLFGVADGG